MASVLALEPVLDLNAAEPLRQALLGARGEPLTLDASRVTRLGGLCLQVLISARKTWTADGRPFALRAPSPEFADQLAAFGGPDLPVEPEGGLS